MSSIILSGTTTLSHEPSSFSSISLCFNFEFATPSVPSMVHRSSLGNSSMLDVIVTPRFGLVSKTSNSSRNSLAISSGGSPDKPFPMSCSAVRYFPHSIARAAALRSRTDRVGSKLSFADAISAAACSFSKAASNSAVAFSPSLRRLARKASSHKHIARWCCSSILSISLRVIFSPRLQPVFRIPPPQRMRASLSYLISSSVRISQKRVSRPQSDRRFEYPRLRALHFVETLGTLRAEPVIEPSPFKRSLYNMIVG